MEVCFSITEHARERFAERWTLGGTIQEVARAAFENGKPLNRSLTKTTILLGYHIDNYWTATYRVYGGTVFVFQKNYKDESDRVTFVLTTLMPLGYLIQRRAEMIQRAVARGALPQALPQNPNQKQKQKRKKDFKTNCTCEASRKCPCRYKCCKRPSVRRGEYDVYCNACGKTCWHTARLNSKTKAPVFVNTYEEKNNQEIVTKETATVDSH